MFLQVILGWGFSVSERSPYSGHLTITCCSELSVLSVVSLCKFFPCQTSYFGQIAAALFGEVEFRDTLTAMTRHEVKKDRELLLHFLRRKLFKVAHLEFGSRQRHVQTRGLQMPTSWKSLTQNPSIKLSYFLDPFPVSGFMNCQTCQLPRRPRSGPCLLLCPQPRCFQDSWGRSKGQGRCQ